MLGVWLCGVDDGLGERALLFINNDNGQIGRTLGLIGKRIKNHKTPPTAPWSKNRPVFDDIKPDGQILFDKSSHQLSSLGVFGMAIKGLFDASKQ